jgi:hypothetical protein
MSKKKIVRAIDGTFVIVPKEPFIDVEDLQERMGHIQIIDEIDKRSDEVIGIPMDDEVHCKNYGKYLLNRPDIIFTNEKNQFMFGTSTKRLSRRL